MTPEQFLSRLQRHQISAAYLFLGSEAYRRKVCREALITALLHPQDHESGITRYDLNQSSLAQVVDDARSLSLFAPRRVILVSNAEAALPRQKAEEDQNGAQPLIGYMKNPSPGVALVFEATRYDLESEDKAKLDRARKFFSAIPDVVELKRFTASEALIEARTLAQRTGLCISESALELLVEALGADVGRIETELHKLALYVVGGKPVTEEDIAALAPDARATTVFALVNALGRRDRVRSLEILDTLAREGEYFPLALAFLSTQLRLALVAAEAGLRSPQQIQNHFSRIGVPMWGARAEQIFQTVTRFSRSQLEQGVRMLFRTDKDLRGARASDQLVMEQLILNLTA